MSEGGLESLGLFGSAFADGAQLGQAERLETPTHDRGLDIPRGGLRGAGEAREGAAAF